MEPRMQSFTRSAALTRGFLFLEATGASTLTLRERLGARTARALGAAAVDAETGGMEALLRALHSATTDLLIIEAGAWLPRLGPLPSLGEGVWLAAGALRDAGHGSDAGSSGAQSADAWRRALARCGGDLARLPWWAKRPPLPPALLIARAAAETFAALLQKTGSLSGAWAGWLRGHHRTVHLPELDASLGDELRVLQVVTTIQIGGAERVTLDLAAELPRHGVAAAVVALGRATRAAFPAPPGFVDLSSTAANPAARATALLTVARRIGADLVHAHLLRASDLAAIAATGLPLVVSAHNLPQGWPPDYAAPKAVRAESEPDPISTISSPESAFFAAALNKPEAANLSPDELPPIPQSAQGGASVPAPNGGLPPAESLASCSRPPIIPAREIQGSPALTLADSRATLLLGCAQVVTRALRANFPTIPARTLWNGIAPQPAPRDRSALGWPEDAWIVLVLANPRAQKRLDRLPAIARALAICLAPRPIRLVLAGATEPGSADAAEALAALDAEIERHAAHEWLLRPGLIENPASLLAAADVLLSVSAWEGLSLAHLEALAAGRPVVATEAGGTREIAAQTSALTILPADASADEIAAVLAALADPVGSSRTASTALPSNFTRFAMAKRAAWLYPQVIRQALRKKAPAGLWLIANNFSTGGAQTSARRLLTALHAQGVKVRAAVIQEDPNHPTPGRTALEAVGIPVLAIPPVHGGPIEPALEPLLEALASDPAPVVFFWNLIASWKILLADALLDARIFDISPGEMFFHSLDRFFEKPSAGLPYRTPRDYGARLAGTVVKYAAEAPRAAEVLGCPVTVIRNGVPCPALPAPRIPRPSQPLVFGTAARLSPDKKLTDLLAAVRLAIPRLPPFVVRIAGGPERDFPQHADELRALAHDLPIEWLGEVRDMPEFLRGLDIFVMISEPAGCPNASLEALAAGLPIIATDFGGAAEQIRHAETGLLTPRADAPAFAEAMVQLAQDPALRARLATAAHGWARTHFSLDAMATAYRQLAGL
jgi:glycosyltransferase involved in cell wall biosynthesis